MSAPGVEPVVSEPLIFSGVCQPAAVRRPTQRGLLPDHVDVVLVGRVALWSTHISSLSTVVCDPDGVPSNVQVLPPSVDSYARIWFCGMAMVSAHAVPSDVQSTAGSVWFESVSAKGSSVWFHVVPPSPL